MKNSQEIANLIKETAKSQKKTVGKMLTECGLSVNTLSSMQSGGYYPRLEAITKIADYLSVSVDYLLGREEPQKINYGVENHGDNNGAINNQVNSTNTSDGISKEMLVKFEELNFTDKVKVMSLIAELSQKE